MPELLEMPHLPDQDGMAKVEIGRRRIKAGLHSQGYPSLADSLEFPLQIFDTYAIDGAFPQVFNLLVYRHAEVHYQTRVRVA